VKIKQREGNGRRNGVAILIGLLSDFLVQRPFEDEKDIVIQVLSFLGIIVKEVAEDELVGVQERDKKCWRDRVRLGVVAS
jgi:hypothetical protein